MLRSMYSGISGMKVNQTKLDVIGNNIANVGTTSFKSQRARFSDMLSQNVKNAMAPTDSQGGVNSSQVGLGVQLASIDTVMSNGNLQSTGRPLDVAIDKAGFFVVSNGPAIAGDSTLQVNHTPGTHTINEMTLSNTNSQLMYTRDGSFILDNEGNLLTGDGYRIMGYSLTNDDNSKQATETSPTGVSAAGLDFKFGPGSQLNGYQVVLGEIGPNTTTSATIDKVAKKIIVNGDFSTSGSLTSDQIKLAISKGLSAAGISQQVAVTGTPRSIEQLSTEAVTGGADATAPTAVTVAGFTVRFAEGSSLNGYKFKIGNVSDPDITAQVNTADSEITINGDFITKGAINGTALKDAINAALSNASINQTVKDVSGVQQSLPGLDAKTTAATVVVAPTLKNEAGTQSTSVDFGNLVIGTNVDKGYASALNGYTLVFGDTTASAALNAVVDKTNKTIRLSGNMATATPADIQTKLNYEINRNGINAELTVAAGGAGTPSSTSKVTFSGGVDYVKPKDIEIAQGFTVSFPAAADGSKNVASPYDNYEIVIENINDTTGLTVTPDAANKKLVVRGNFVSPGEVSRADLETKLNLAFGAPGGIKVSGSSRVYTGLISDTVEGGEELRSPNSTSALGMTFDITEGSQLNGYKIQIGTVTSGTKTSATVNNTNKIITINGDFVTGNLTGANISTALNNALRNKGFNQGIRVTGNPITLNGSESEATYGGTAVQSLAEDGTVNFVDGTGDVKSYDSSLKSLKIPDKVKLPGTETELRVKSYTIDKSGIINGILEDGRVAALGQIAMANFKNPEGLTKLGGNLYNKSVNSGDALIRSGVGTLGEDNSLGYGVTIQNMLEMSNVDLAEQFTDMITATRAFQANGKIISTGDEVLQDIINLKR